MTVVELVLTFSLHVCDCGAFPLQCTASCGGGVQRRTVQCLLGGQPASDCFLHQKPETSLACNTHFCPISEKRGEYRAPQLDLGVSGGDVKLLE